MKCNKCYRDCTHAIRNICQNSNYIYFKKYSDSMDGYRYLNIGEKVNKTDQVYSAGLGWVVNYNTFKKVAEFNNEYRRKVR